MLAAGLCVAAPLPGPIQSLVAWDFLPAREGYGAVVLSAVDENEAEFGSGPGADDDFAHRVKRWSSPTGGSVVGNSQLQQVGPDGGLRYQYVQGCTGSPMSYNTLSHELTIDATSPDLIEAEWQLWEGGLSDAGAAQPLSLCRAVRGRDGRRAHGERKRRAGDVRAVLAAFDVQLVCTAHL